MSCPSAVLVQGSWRQVGAELPPPGRADTALCIPSRSCAARRRAETNSAPAKHQREQPERGARPRSRRRAELRCPQVAPQPCGRAPDPWPGSCRAVASRRGAAVAPPLRAGRRRHPAGPPRRADGGVVVRPRGGDGDSSGPPAGRPVCLRVRLGSRSRSPGDSGVCTAARAGWRRLRGRPRPRARALSRECTGPCPLSTPSPPPLFISHAQVLCLDRRRGAACTGAAGGRGRSTGGYATPLWLRGRARLLRARSPASARAGGAGGGQPAASGGGLGWDGVGDWTRSLSRAPLRTWRLAMKRSPEPLRGPRNLPAAGPSPRRRSPRQCSNTRPPWQSLPPPPPGGDWPGGDWPRHCFPRPFSSGSAGGGGRAEDRGMDRHRGRSRGHGLEVETGAGRAPKSTGLPAASSPFAEPCRRRAAAGAAVGHGGHRWRRGQEGTDSPGTSFYPAILAIRRCRATCACR
jgi:hypothetical protein